MVTVVVVSGVVVVDGGGGREVVDTTVVVVLDALGVLGVLVESGAAVVLDDESLDVDDEHAPRSRTAVTIIDFRIARLLGVLIE